MLAEALISSKYYISEGSLNNNNTAPLMSTILSEFGEACISLLRQGTKVANTYRTEEEMGVNRSFIKIIISVLRVGGASYVWLIVYGLMFVASGLGFIMALVKRHILPWEAQDPVEILHMALSGSGISEVTFLRFEEEFRPVDTA
jgi:hypothetical protein